MGTLAMDLPGISSVTVIVNSSQTVSERTNRFPVSRCELFANVARPLRNSLRATNIPVLRSR